MFRSNSPYGSTSSSYAASLQSIGYSTMDEGSSQVSGLSRPSGRSIYLQRRVYAKSVNEKMRKPQYRVEHLFTCDLDGNDLRSIADCVDRLKLLDGMGQVWGQNMLLEVRGLNLLLVDVETKEELENMALSDILEIKSVLGAGEFKSLLILSVKLGRKKPTTTVFMFQCEDIGAEYVQRDLSRAVSRSREDPGFGSSAGHTAEGVKHYHNAVRTPEPREQSPSLQWNYAYEEDAIYTPELLISEQEEEEDRETSPFRDQPPTHHYTQLHRDVDILNHILSDIEMFMGKVAAVAAKNTKKKKKKKGKVMPGMPPTEEFAECLHKIKYGFNLLAELNGKINNPSASEIIHSLFNILIFVIPHYPEHLPPTIVAPLLTPQCIHLLSEEASTEEDQLWQTLGDAWNIPSTRWPEDGEDIPLYTLEFSDGWKPNEVSAEPAHSEPASRQESPQPEPRQSSSNWRPTHHLKTRSDEAEQRRMCVKSDFISRNPRELSVSKGETVQLLDTAKQWWKVRNSSGEEGYVPNNVFSTPEEQPEEQPGGSPVLTRKSTPVEVKAWLEDKGFSKITVRCLGVLKGSSLLGMTREELKMVCPEEGGRVFLQLQAVKSAGFK